MAAFGLPKSTPAEAAERRAAIQAATRQAIDVPLKVMQTALASMEVIQAMAEIGNPNSVSDAGVGALCARTAVLGAFLNVKTNAVGLDDKAFVAQVLAQGREIEQRAMQKEAEVLAIVGGKIGV
jgi:glutamate formiminotransferase/formiminotetrahydrofolate cyclodeaminase